MGIVVPVEGDDFVTAVQFDSLKNARIDARFSRQERTLAVHTWMLGVIVVTVLAPTLKGLLL